VKTSAPKGRLSTDPAFTTALDWQRVGGLLLTLWWLAGSALGFVGSLLLAHGMLPSLGATRDLPASTVRLARPPLYLAAATFVALGGVSVFLFLDRVDLLKGIFDKGLA
jgi:hypothetical protein